MRNIWYPRKMATYVTVSKLEELGVKDITAERDPLFGSNKERRAADRERREAKAAAAMLAVETNSDTVVVPSVAETNVDSSSSTLAEPSAALFMPEESESSVSEPIAEPTSPPVEEAVVMTVRP